MTERAQEQEQDRCRKGLQAAAHRRAVAVAEHRAATADLAVWCRRAATADLTVTEIAQRAGLSRERTYQLLQEVGGKPSKRRKP